MEKSKKRTFSALEVQDLLDMGKTLKNLGPNEQRKALDIARQKLSSNPLQESNLGVDLKDFKAVVPMGNQRINDISMVKGEVPVDSTTQIIKGIPEKERMLGTVSNTTEHLSPALTQRLISGDEFALKQATSAMEREAKLAAKTAALNGLKSGGKKLLSTVPILGSLAGVAMSGDVMAASPIPGLESEEAGRGSDTQMESVYDKPENGYMSPERMRRLNKNRFDALK